MTDQELFNYLKPQILNDATLHTLWMQYQDSGFGQDEFLRNALKYMAKDKVSLREQIIDAAKHSYAPSVVLLRDTKSWRELTPGQRRLLHFFAKLGIGRKETL